jgi:hypothetical protein
MGQVAAILANKTTLSKGWELIEKFLKIIFRLMKIMWGLSSKLES